jgi:bifunctional non-homologous end joining protein LigD
MQVYVPLNVPGVTYEDTRTFSRGLAGVLLRRMPDLIVGEMNRERRRGKVYVDWSQNDRHKTTVNVYSLRAMERPTVSTPLTWDEVSDMSEPLSFTSAEVLERVERLGDLFAPVQTLEQEIPR